MVILRDKEVTILIGPTLHCKSQSRLVPDPHNGKAPTTGVIDTGRAVGQTYLKVQMWSSSSEG